MTQHTSRKRLVYITAAMAGTAALALTGCASNGGGDAGDGADRTLRLAHVYEAAHPVETCGISTLNEELAGSGLTVESFPAAQLGSEAESLEQLSTGSLDIAIAGASFLGTWYEPAAVLDAGYLFDDVDHYMATISGETMQGVFDDLAAASGMRVQSGWYYGTRQVTANKEISTPADMAGVKIRTPDAPMYLTNIELMGGTATPMALGEVYLALQQGVIDAQENPVPTIATAKFNEVQDYINITNHMVQGVYLISQDSLTDSLSEEQQAALESALAKAADAVHECILADEQSIVDEWKADGSIQVNEDVDIASFSEAAQEHFASDSAFGELYTEIRNSR